LDIVEIPVEEVNAVIRKLQNGKAIGTDGIQAELLKHGDNEFD